MTAGEIIEEIKRLPEDEQNKVLEFVRHATQNRRLTPEELGESAQRMVDINDPAEAEQLQQKIVRGFYGGEAL